MSRRLATSFSLLGLAGCSILGGCSAQDARLASYRANPSPEVDTLSQRHDDIDNALTITTDTNFRMMNEEIGRVLLLDRPSRGSMAPIPH